MDDPEGYPVSDVLQASATVAGLAIALATFAPTTWLTFVFAMGGLVALISTGYALAVLWRRRGLEWLDLIAVRRTERLDAASAALVWFAWALMILGVAYGVLLL